MAGPQGGAIRTPEWWEGNTVLGGRADFGLEQIQTLLGQMQWTLQQSQIEKEQIQTQLNALLAQQSAQQVEVLRLTAMQVQMSQLVQTRQHPAAEDSFPRKSKPRMGLRDRLRLKRQKAIREESFARTAYVAGASVLSQGPSPPNGATSSDEWEVAALDGADGDLAFPQAFPAEQLNNSCDDCIAVPEDRRNVAAEHRSYAHEEKQEDHPLSTLASMNEAKQLREAMMDMDSAAFVPDNSADAVDNQACSHAIVNDERPCPFSAGLEELVADQA
eukprot:TRINITY_DN71284_c0_g1_i1.p1 TRINITY_DN71284_c0_g1~~TRINITY_DN71284_c0_g1_i1.p1  ORF type:complete len:274 (-),score=47.34 TRINITY_DN71284_c0_g1_i1:564-1385(-)